jgi:CHAT domain-containing protein
MRRFIFYASMCVLCLLLLSTALFAQDMERIQQLMKEIQTKIMNGLQMQQSHEYLKAGKTLEEALVLEEEFKKQVQPIPGFEKSADEQLFMTLSSAAYNYRCGNEIEKSVELYTRAMAMAKKNGNRLKEASLNCDIAALYGDVHDLKRVLYHGMKARDILSHYAKDNFAGADASERRVFLRVLNDWRLLYVDYYVASLYEMKKFDDAVNELNDPEFTDIQKSLREVSIELLAKNLPDIMRSQSDNLPDIVNTFIAIDMGNVSSTFLTITTKGMCQRSKGDYEQALKTFQEAEEYMKSVDFTQKATLIKKLAADLSDWGKNLGPEVSGRVQGIVSALGDDEANETPLIYAINIRYHRGRTYQKMGDDKKACELFDAIIKDCERLPYYKKLILPKIYHARAESLYNMGSFEESMSFSKKAMSAFDTSCLFLGDRYKNQTLMGKLWEQKKDFRNATEAYKRSIEDIEKLALSLNTGVEREEFYQDKVEPYEGMIRMLINQGRAEEALQYAEKSRARSLVEQYGVIVPQNRLSDDEKRKFNAKKLEFRNLYKEMRTGKEKTPEEAENRYKQLMNDMEQLISGKGNDYFELQRAQVVLSRDIQGMLDKESVIFEYYYTSGSSVISPECYLWTITTEAVEVIKLPLSPSSMENNIRQLRKAIAERRDEWKDLAGELYGALIKPGEKALAGKKLLIISPYKYLHYLPFAVLLKGQKPLIEDYGILITPSMTALKICRDKKIPPGDKMVAYSIGSYVAKGFTPLPGTDVEVNNIAAIFPDNTIIKGKDFTLESIPPGSKDKNIIHFATHGIMNADDPKASGLLASNGEFTVENTFGLEIHPRIVVLSACNTGLGKLYPGDDQVGLTRSLMFAGTPSILSSLWSVSDDSTVKLMTYFYKNLSGKINKAESLRQAELTLMKEYPHPFFWAPFILTGEWK